MIAITFALPAESAGFLRLLRDRERRRCGDTHVIGGKIENRNIEILHTGVGEKICRRRIAMLLQDRQFDLLISAGFAGALNDRLKVGDILIAKNFSTVNIDRAESLLSNLPVQVGDLFTTSRVIDSQKERSEIARSTSAGAVDMETDFIARVCAEHSLPMLSLRAISDTPVRPLPVPPRVLFDIDQQKTRLAKLSLYLLKHPTRVSRMILFARQARKARHALTYALETLLRRSVVGEMPQPL